MPELAEVEIVRRNLETWWVTGASDVIWHDPELALGDQHDVTNALMSAPTAFLRKGKHLLVETEGGNVYFHFRMSGKIVRRESPMERFARLSWQVGDAWLSFADFRRLGEVWFYPPGYVPEPWETIGPEPMDVTVEHLEETIGPRRTLKAALLDQKVLAGVGNIAVTEVFWTLGLRPDVRWGEVDENQRTALVEELPRYFNWVIEEQASDEVHYTGETGADNPFTMYRRDGEACPRCGTLIERTVIGSRSSYFCPTCQA